METLKSIVERNCKKPEIEFGVEKYFPFAKYTLNKTANICYFTIYTDNEVDFWACNIKVKTFTKRNKLKMFFKSLK